MGYDPATPVLDTGQHLDHNAAIRRQSTKNEGSSQHGTAHVGGPAPVATWSLCLVSRTAHCPITVSVVHNMVQRTLVDMSPLLRCGLGA